MNVFTKLFSNRSNQFTVIVCACAIIGVRLEASSQEPFPCLHYNASNSIHPFATIEAEDCTNESNSQFGDTSNNACAQHLSPLSIWSANSFVLYGYSESAPDAGFGQGIRDVDDFYWTVNMEGFFSLFFMANQSIDYKIGLFNISDSSVVCDLDAYADCETCSPEDFNIDGGKCVRNLIRWVQPGSYIIRIVANHSNNLGCGQFRYRLNGFSSTNMPFQNFQDDSLDMGGWARPILVENHYDESLAFPQDNGTLGADRYCAAGDIDGTYSEKGDTYAFQAVSTKTIISFHSTGLPDFDGLIGMGQFGIGVVSGCFNTSGPNEKEVVILDTEPGIKYLFCYYENTRIIPTGTVIQCNVTQIPRTEIRAADCGRMNLVNSSIIRSNWPLNRSILSNKIVKWRFKFEELEAPFNTYEVMSPNGSNPQFRWHWFAQRQPGRTYRVWTQVLMQPGPTWSDYGTACVIGTAGTPIGSPSGLAEQLDTATWGADLGEVQTAEIWPNPTNSDINISVYTDINQETMDVSIYDTRGMEVDRVTQSLNGMGYALFSRPMNHLAAGIYFVHVRTDIGTTVKKVIVKHD